MKLNFSGWYQGLLGLEDKVIDYSNLKIRRRATEGELRKYYDQCIDKLEDISEYFVDQEALKKVNQDILSSKAPKLVARDSVYPGLFNVKYHTQILDNLLNPEKAVEESKYFYVPECRTVIPLKEGSPFMKLMEEPDPEQEREGKKPENAIIIPNDRTKAKTKGHTFHETLHYVILNYQIETGWLFTEDGKFKKRKDRHIAENFMHEAVVEELTDILLEDDEEALFALRWDRHELFDRSVNSVKALSVFISGGSTGLIIGTGFSYPWLLPFLPVPTIIKNKIYQRYKNSKRDEILRPRERKKFEI